MPKNKLTLLVPIAALLATASAWAGGGGDGSPATGRDYVAAELDKLLQRKLPAAGEMQCDYPSCASGCTEECKAATAKYIARCQSMPAEFYAGVFNKDAANWPIVAELVRERFACTTTTCEQKGLLLDLACYAPNEIASKLGEELWSVERKSFSPSHVLDFAGRGSEIFTNEIRAQVKKQSCGKDVCDIRPAAFLALRGDASGEKVLQQTLQTACFEQGSIARPMVAALALEDLGRKGVLADVRKQVEKAALDALDAGNLDRARSLALEAEFFTLMMKKSQAYGKKLDLAWLEERLAGYCQEKSAELADADQVFKRIESVCSL